jgi:hypothetical protein
MICANKECGIEFEPKTHNQKYCKDECCRIATNKRIMEKYYERKAIRNGSIVRLCEKCKAKLSVYHNDKVCSPCQKKINEADRDKLLRNIYDIS